MPVLSAAVLRDCNLVKPVAWSNKQASSQSLVGLSQSEVKAGFKRLNGHWADYSGAAKSTPTGKGDAKAVIAGNNYDVHVEGRDDEGEN